MTENELRTKSNIYNKITTEKQFIHELYNAVVNHKVIMKAFDTGRAVDLSKVAKHTHEKCLILGSGPSLDDAMPYLKDWKYGIICTTSHATTLLYHGIEPTYILALDPFARWHEIDGIDWAKYKTKLITCPTVWPDLIKKWPNEILLYLQNQGAQNTFYHKELQQIYSDRVNIKGAGERDFEFRPRIKTQMTLFSCSPPAQLFAAQCLGYDTCYLVGVDFAYNKQKTRFTAWFKNSGKWKKNESLYKPDTKKYKEQASNATERDLVTNNGLLATSQMMFYKKNMMSAMRLSMQNVIVVGKGSITELPNISPKDLIKKQDYKAARLKPNTLKKVLEDYLAEVGGYVLLSTTTFNMQEAYTFMECEKPEIDIPVYLAQMKLIYNCDKCNSELKANDYKHPIQDIQELEQKYIDNNNQINPEIAEMKEKGIKEIFRRIRGIGDHTGEECPQCKQGKLKPKFLVDIDKNMNRIRRRINASKRDN